MVDQAKTLEFLHDLCEAALTDARKGDTALANKLGSNRALQFYFTNVHSIPTMTDELFARNYPQYLAEADRVRLAHESNAALEEKVDGLVGQLGELKALVQQMLEAQQAKPEPEAEPEKPAKKAKKQADEAEAVEGETEGE